MILQKIYLTENTDGLYSHGSGTVWYKNDSVILGKGARWSTDAYLNAFSVGKWCTYCDLKKITLHLKLRGSLIVRVFYSYINRDHKLCRRQIAGGCLEAPDGRLVRYGIPVKRQGIVYFALQALSEGAVCSGAFYEGEAGAAREVTLALNICTYKREAQLTRNLELLRRAFLENTDSVLYGHLQVFITDNGRTLPAGKLQDGSVHVCHNPNVGGAGGFARGLIEIEKVRQQKGITHVIFMDDDVEILPEGITRTYTVLRCLRERYQSAFIAGAMLRMDKRYIQHENGALWNAGNCHFVGRGADLRRFADVVRNETGQARDYAAWWYCCVPAGNLRQDNLPLPVFIHGDDVEYSLRNAKGILTMNGICVWHPAADNMRASGNEYYNLRNMLVVNAKYCPDYGKRRLAKTMTVRLLTALLRYRYRDMHLVYWALADFCRGPEWLRQADAQAYHQKILGAGYQMTDVSEKVKHCRQIECSTLSEGNSVGEIFGRAMEHRGLCGFLWQVFSLNGWILPPIRETVAVLMGVHPVDLYRTGRIVLYDDRSMQGIEVRRSFRQVFVFLALCAKSLWLVCTKYDGSKAGYRGEWASLYGMEYWGRLYDQ